MAAINTLALKSWLTFTQGFVRRQLLQHSWLYLLVGISFLTGVVALLGFLRINFSTFRRIKDPRETLSLFQKGTVDPVSMVLCYLRALRFRLNRKEKTRMTVQHILELLGLTRTDRRIEHNLHMGKKKTI